MFAYNFDTYRYDDIKHLPSNPTELLPYVPAIPAARMLFDYYVKRGDDVLVAYEKTLLAVLGKPAPPEVEP